MVSMRKDAAQYLRVSTGLQDRSMAQQAGAIATYAARRRFRIVQTYSDAAASGLTLQGRPALRQLLADVLKPNRAFQAILVYDVSRWGRFQDIDQGAHYEFLCRKAGVDVVYCAEPFENDGSPEAELIKQFKRASAAEFSRELSQRAQQAHRFFFQQGFRASGTPPYGYERIVTDPYTGKTMRMSRGSGQAPPGWRTRLDPGPPQDVETVRKVFSLFVEDQFTCAQIAERLEESGAPRRRGPWSAHAVRDLLRREEYIGTSIYGRTHQRLGQRKRTSSRETIMRVENAWPPIISVELFHAARARMADLISPSTETLKADLREALERHGKLNTRLLDSDDKAYSTDTYRRHFGSLGAAYEAIGYRPGPRQGLRRTTW